MKLLETNFWQSFLKGEVHVSKLDQFTETVLKIFDILAPIKKRFVWAYHGPFMTKELQKQFMIRSRLRNRFLFEKTNQSREAYNRQRNYCVDLLRKTRHDFYGKLDPKSITDNKRFLEYSSATTNVWQVQTFWKDNLVRRQYHYFW